MEHALNGTLLCLRLNQRSRVHRGKILAHFKLSRCAVWFLTTGAAHRFFPVLAPSMTECLHFFGAALMPSIIYRGFCGVFCRLPREGPHRSLQADISIALLTRRL